MWSTGEGNGKPLQYSCLENFMNSMTRQNDMTLKDELPRLISLKNDRMISVHFQGKPFNMTVIRVYAPTSNAEEVEDELFYEDL